MDNQYDVVIIGGGVTGYGAGMYAGRLGLKTLIVGDILGGTIILTNIVENYPGFKKTTGQELADALREHALDYKDFVSIKEGRVTKIERNSPEESFVVHVGEEPILAKTIIYATGTKWKELQVPGHDEYRNRGVHYCALCDGFFYRGKDVAIVGGGDSAAKEALLLAEHASNVYVLIRGDSLHAEPVNKERILKSPNIKIVTSINITDIKGDDKGVTHVELDKEHNGSKELKLDGIFVAIGHIALSDVAKEAGVELNQKGEIKINRKAETNVPGFFAAGDVVDTHFKQAIIGVAEGVMASYSAYQYTTSKKIIWAKVLKN
jgi:thioredoxin-disulfide reductase